MPEIIIECPLGGQCEHIKDNKIHRCAWYTKLVGKDPQSNKDIDEWACTMSWIPIMLAENAQMVRGVREATETRGDAQIQNQIKITKEAEKLNDILTTAMENSQKRLE